MARPPPVRDRGAMARTNALRTAAPRRPSLARLASAVLAALVAVGVAAPTPAAAADLTVAQAEATMVELLNDDRAAAGLVPLRLDSRLMAIARARSTDMASRHYFSHTQPDGRDVFDLIVAAKIAWYGAGENIAWNNHPTLAASTTAANQQWLGSSGHRKLILSTSYNYVGVGLAFDRTANRHYWTAVFLKGPDRTGAQATLGTPRVAAATSTTSRRVTISWSGADVPLQVLTAGLQAFWVQRRVDGGTWLPVHNGTTLRSLTQDLAANHTYDYRVVARDKAGNWGAWATTSIRLSSRGAVTVTR